MNLFKKFADATGWTWAAKKLYDFRTKPSMPLFSIQAIDSTDKKLALMEWDNIWEPALTTSATAPFTQANKQQLLWGYPGVLWDSAAAGTVTKMFKGPNLGKTMINTDWGGGL